MRHGISTEKDYHHPGSQERDSNYKITFAEVYCGPLWEG